MWLKASRTNGVGMTWNGGLLKSHMHQVAKKLTELDPQLTVTKS
jgi:hypothetical protein